MKLFVLITATILATSIFLPSNLISQTPNRLAHLKIQGNYRAFEVFVDTFIRKAQLGDQAYLETLMPDTEVQGKKRNDIISAWKSALRDNQIKNPVKYKCIGIKKCDLEIKFRSEGAGMSVTFIKDQGGTGWLATGSDISKSTENPVSN